MDRISIQDLASVLTIKNGLKKKEAEQFVTMIFDVVKDHLKSERLVKIKGLGTFKVVEMEARESINVNTGERVLIEGHEKVTFTPDTSMKELVNKPFSQFETVVLNEGIDFDNMTVAQALMKQEEEETPEEVVAPVAKEELVAEPLVEESVKVSVNESAEPIEEPVVEPIEKPAINIIEEPEVPLAHVEEDKVEMPPVEEDETPVVKEEYVPVVTENEVETVDEEMVEAADDKTVAETTDDVEEVKTMPDEENTETIDEDIVEVPTDETVDTMDTDTETVEMTDYETEIVEETVETTDDEPINDEEEETVYDDEKEEKKHSVTSVIWICLALVACILSFFAGYQVGVRQAEVGQEVTDSVPVLVKNSANTTDTVKTDTVKADTIKKKEVASVVAPAPKTQPQPVQAAPVVTAETPEVDYKKYEQMDVRIRTGAYRIVGTAKEVTAKEGETIKQIAQRNFGSEMECYVEAYNGIKGDAPLTAGQIIKIPKLQWKKKKTNQETQNQQ